MQIQNSQIKLKKENKIIEIIENTKNQTQKHFSVEAAPANLNTCTIYTISYRLFNLGLVSRS